MANTTSYAILAVLPIIGWFLYIQLYSWRFSKFNHIPQSFPNSLLFGHLKSLAEGFKHLGDSKRHHDYMFEMLLQDAGRPDFMFVDLRPVNQPMVIVASHEIAEQISRATKLYPTSVLKSPTVQSGLARLIGAYSIITEEGESWKGLRKRFNPGFAHSHLISLLPTIIAKSTTFMGKLDGLAESKREFELDPLCTNLTFDIIGDIVTNIDLKAQEPNTHTIVYHFKELSKTYSDTGRVWLWANVPLRIKRLYHSYCVDAAIKECIKEKFTEIKATQSIETKETRDRSVLALALKDIDVLTSESLQITADQVKSFFFAGHDTTSILLQWLFYALSIHPGCLKAIRDEHDTVFGDRDPREVFLSKPDETVKSLSYTAACIKEALRLWPPAASARLSIPRKGFKVRLSDGQEVCLDGTILYQCHYLIQRDPKVYGDTVNDFMPERWLGDHDTASTNRDEEGSEMGMSKVPNSAWRPFERGPRNCIGQELANLEARVILACVMRRYNFVKVGAGEIELDEKGNPTVDDKGKCRTKSELFNSNVVTSKPYEKCCMRVELHRA